MNPQAMSKNTGDGELDNAITEIFTVIDNYGTAGEARHDIKNLIAQEANKAELKHSIGILDNVIMLGKDLEYPKEALINACVEQRDELSAQLKEKESSDE